MGKENSREIPADELYGLPLEQQNHLRNQLNGEMGLPLVSVPGKAIAHYGDQTAKLPALPKKPKKLSWLILLLLGLALIGYLLFS